MTDRELLEAAARAAGYVVRWYDDTLRHGPTFGIEVEPGNPCGFDTWNPLQDDGDRYRLLQALKMGIDFDAQAVIYTLDGSTCEESFRDDGDDARAVLRAAAEIGRARK